MNGIKIEWIECKNGHLSQDENIILIDNRFYYFYRLFHTVLDEFNKYYAIFIRVYFGTKFEMGYALKKVGLIEDVLKENEIDEYFERKYCAIQINYPQKNESRVNQFKVVGPGFFPDLSPFIQDDNSWVIVLKNNNVDKKLICKYEQIYNNRISNPKRFIKFVEEEVEVLFIGNDGASWEIYCQNEYINKILKSITRKENFIIRNVCLEDSWRVSGHREHS